MRIQNMLGRTGRPVANQFEIYADEGVYFQSYNSIIAFKPLEGKIQLDTDTWDYSQTTGKYRNFFLRETKSETERKIENGTYKLVNLNK